MYKKIFIYDEITHPNHKRKEKLKERNSSVLEKKTTVDFSFPCYSALDLSGQLDYGIFLMLA